MSSVTYILYPPTPYSLVPFFQAEYEHREFVTLLCVQLEPQIYSPSEVVISINSRMQGMYLIQEGVAFKCLSFDEPFQVYGIIKKKTKTVRGNKVSSLLESYFSLLPPNFTTIVTLDVLWSRRCVFKPAVHIQGYRLQFLAYASLEEIRSG